MDQQSMKVLLVEDNPGDARLLREMFNARISQSIAVTHVETMAEAESYVARHAIDVFVLDLGLPDAQGLGAVRRAHVAAPHIPLVVLTGLDDEALAARALQSGAQDYLIKGQIETPGVMRAVRYAIERKIMEIELNNEVAELKRTEAELRDSELMLRLALDASGQGVWRWEVGPDTSRLGDAIRLGDTTRLGDTNRLAWDARCKALFGLASDAPVSYATWTGAIVSEDLAMAEAGITRALDPADPLDDYACEYRALHPDGAIHWVATAGRAVFEPDLAVDSGRRAVRVIGTSRDVSRRKRADHERDVRQRELERSNAELDRFAYVASHDLKAPLRGIEHLVDWITEDIAATANPETALNLTLLTGRVSRMRMLLNGLLAYSRVGRIQSAVEDVDIAREVHDIVAMLEPPPGFVISCEGEMPVFRTYRVPIRAVLENLIGNGLKHHDRAEGRINVTMGLVDGMAEFRVSDDGPGIPPEFHDRIFVMFQTLASRDDVESCGIGLAIVKKHVEDHGGHILVVSAPLARGTTFAFTWKVQ